MNIDTMRRDLVAQVLASAILWLLLPIALAQTTEHAPASTVPRSLQDVFDTAERQAKQVTQPDQPAPASGTSQPALSADRAQTADLPPRLYILVSFGMPDAALTRLAAQAARLHVPLVLRGLAGDSLAETARRARPLIEAAPGASLEIDPLPFRRFGVTQVPAFVLTVPAPGCVSACDARPATAVLVGDVSLDYALGQLAREPSPLASTAAALLAAWRKQP